MPGEKKLPVVGHFKCLHWVYKTYLNATNSSVYMQHFILFGKQVTLQP